MFDAAVGMAVVVEASVPGVQQCVMLLGAEGSQCRTVNTAPGLSEAAHSGAAMIIMNRGMPRRRGARIAQDPADAEGHWRVAWETELWL